MNVTVVIPAYNAGGTIERALSSIAAQSLLPSRIIVVNDGSADDTVARASGHLVGQAVPLQVISIKNSGVSFARNLGIRSADTEFIALLDADDEFLPEHIALAEAAFSLRPDAVVHWAGIRRVFDGDSVVLQIEANSLPDFDAVSRRHAVEDLGDGHSLIGDSVFNDLIKGNFICSAVFRRALSGQPNLFNEQIRFAEDRLFYLRLLGLGQGVFTDRCTMLIHRDGNNASVTADPSRSHGVNGKVLLALQHAKALESINRHPDRMRIVDSCIANAVHERIYYASFKGLPEFCRSLVYSYRTPEYRIRSRLPSVGKNFLRALARSLAGVPGARPAG